MHAALLGSSLRAPDCRRAEPNLGWVFRPPASKIDFESGSWSWLSFLAVPHQKAQGEFSLRSERFEVNG
jgi:hypothetical protein